jgi:hypothetical protein
MLLVGLVSVIYSVTQDMTLMASLADARAMWKACHHYHCKQGTILTPKVTQPKLFVNFRPSGARNLTPL